jgi:predicted translin family RNA/ssDNA-binding protein
MNKFDFDKFSKKTNEGLYTIYKLDYTIDDQTDFINVTDFKTGYEEVVQAKFVYDLKKGNRPLQFNKRKSTMQMHFL